MRAKRNLAQKNSFIFEDSETGHLYKVTRTGMSANPMYEVVRHTREESFVLPYELTELEKNIVSTFIASNRRAQLIGANNLVTSLGVRPDGVLPTEDWVIADEGRTSEGDYVVNYVNSKDETYKASYHVQHTDQGRRVSFILGKHFPIVSEEIHRESEEYKEVLSLAKYWLTENPSYVHVYIFYPVRTIDDIVGE